MTATFKVLDGNTSVSFTYTAQTEKVIETVKACVKNLYQPDQFGEGVEMIPFDQLTNQQILDFLDQCILEMIINNAKSQLRVKLMDEKMIIMNSEIDLALEAKFL
jgi:hypothetical protein